ncbi:hypothetical protein ACPXAM_24065, partial [Escherichia coli]|uniref:hypothetical protein n=1 Tax=Escherichia coli TaxID=562 RepID=UPI003CE5068F
MHDDGLPGCGAHGSLERRGCGREVRRRAYVDGDVVVVGVRLDPVDKLTGPLYRDESWARRDVGGR